MVDRTMMDSRSRLDYALFQLTPTRTRCDLVICAGDSKEKLASGLLEPFLAHLKFAKDQISKGGYSITLSASASWFTKSTLERFVRFVSTPEVLERFITIEREIANIDYSIHTNASQDSRTEFGLVPEGYANKSANAAYKHEFDRTSDAVHEEDPKVHLQRVLETRKAVLQKEQAMVYARALVAGFETDNLEDLICFADAFGSPRLREACLNFMELCNTKSNDGVWMDEVAAMQAYSRSQNSYMGTSGGIILSGEDDPSQELMISVGNGNFVTNKQNGAVDGTASDLSLSHGSHLPQYMHNYQGGPMFQPPYQGYPFPSLPVPPYYQGNLPWPLNVEDFRSRGKRSPMKGSRGLKQDGNFDSSESSSGSDSGNYRRSSSQKVVIRNINYITSKRDGETECESDGGSSDGAVNQDPDRTVEDNPEGQKVTQQWDIFQNLLMQDADDKESEEGKKPRKGSSDPFVLTERDSFNEKNDHVKNLRSGEDVSPVIKKYSTYEEELFSHKFEEPKINPSGTLPKFATKSSTIRRHEEGDRFLGSLPDETIQEKSRDIFEDRFQSVESRKDVLVDDPLAVQARSLNPSSDSQLRTEDIFMVSESNLIQKAPYSSNEKLHEKVEAACINEPDDLYMALERDTAGQQAVATWTPEMEFGNSNNKIVKLDSADDMKPPSRGKETKTRSRASVGQGLERKGSTVEAKSKALVGSLGKSKSDIISRSKKSRGTKTTIQKGKSEKEEEKRKKMEELLTQRQKRIAERSASSTKAAKSDKPKAQLASRDMKKSNKPVIRSSTIDRLSAAHVINPKVLPTESKPGNKPRKATTKENDVLHTSFSHRTAGDGKKKVKPDKVKHPDKNIGPKNANGLKKEKIADLNNVKQSRSVSSVKKTGKGVAHVGLSVPPNHQSAQSDHMKGASEIVHKASPVLQDDIALSNSNDSFCPDKTLDHPSTSVNKALNSTSFNLDEDSGAKENPIVKVNHEIPVIEISTPPPGKGSPEGSTSRKKWSNGETSAKALTGFRKLLSFGRRS